MTNTSDDTDLDDLLSTDLTQAAEDVQHPVGVGLPVEEGQEVDCKHSGTTVSGWDDTFPPQRPLRTVLSEFGGAEYGGNPERLFRTPLERQVSGQVGAAVEILLAAGQAQVQTLVTEGGVLIALHGAQRRSCSEPLGGEHDNVRPPSPRDRGFLTGTLTGGSIFMS